MTRMLVCPPRYFGVEYVINPWMAGNVGTASSAAAMRQWDALVGLLQDRGEVTAIEPQAGLPDMCFAANGGLVLDGTFVPPTFSVAQREPETALYRRWAEGAGFEVPDVRRRLDLRRRGRRAVVALPGLGTTAVGRLRRAHQSRVAPRARRTVCAFALHRSS